MAAICLPPTLNTPPSGTFYIGLTGAQLTGSNFSTVSRDNVVWFPGGTPAFATSATTSQLTFDIPPGAVSGNIFAGVQNDLATDGSKGDVYLENPTGNGLTVIRTMGFAKATGDFWFSGTAGGVSGFYRYYYDAATTKKWVREDRSGTYTGNILYCSTKTDRFGRIFCAYGATTTSASSRFAQTNPPGNLQLCRSLNLPGGDTGTAKGAAADPNPDAVAGRDVVYFAVTDVTLSKTYIRRLASDCSSILDMDWGNQNGAWNLQSNAGMTVDRDGNLYVSTGTTVVKVALDESVTTVKTGFTRLFGIDAKQEKTGGPVTFIGADAPAIAGNPSTLYAWSSDSPAAPKVARATTAQRFASWGATVFGLNWSVSQLTRNIVLGNDNTLFTIDQDPRMDVTPYSFDTGRAWISSPVTDPSDVSGTYQSHVRPSVGAASTDYSVVEVTATWKDGVPRLTCARSGDTWSSASYDQAPTTPINCGRAWSDIGASCDNQEGFVAGGPGSFTENDGFTYCSPTLCGGSLSPACKVHLRVSKQYAGDNYQVYFTEANDPLNEVIAATGPITAWKHVFLESDPMCRKGGILHDSYGATGECGGAQPACCGSGGQLPCNQIKVYTWSTGGNGDTITVFDEARPFSSGETRSLVAPNIDNLDGTKTLTLSAPLTHSYNASLFPASGPLYPTFTNGHAGGYCVSNGGVTPAFDNNPSLLPRTFDDAFASLVPSGDGRGIVPYLAPSYFDILDANNSRETIFNYAQIWFQHRNLTAINNATNDPSNYWHIVASEKPGNIGNAGLARFLNNTAYVFSGSIEDTQNTCYFQLPTRRDCTATEIDNYNGRVSGHEPTHLFGSLYDENTLEYPWCGATTGQFANMCPHPDGVAPNSGYNYQTCMMFSDLTSHDVDTAMKTGGMYRLDCQWLKGFSCNSEPAGSKINIRAQPDPQ